MYLPGIATRPLFPQRRLEQRVGHVLFCGGTFDQSLGAVEPEGGVAAEALAQARYLLVVGARQVHGDLRRHATRRPGMDLLFDERGIEGRVNVEEFVEAFEQLPGEEVYIFEEPDKDPLFRVARSPVLEGP